MRSNCLRLKQVTKSRSQPQGHRLLSGQTSHSILIMLSLVNPGSTWNPVEAKDLSSTFPVTNFGSDLWSQIELSTYGYESSELAVCWEVRKLLLKSICKFLIKCDYLSENPQWLTLTHQVKIIYSLLREISYLEIALISSSLNYTEHVKDTNSHLETFSSPQVMTNSSFYDSNCMVSGLVHKGSWHSPRHLSGYPTHNIILPQSTC